MWIKIIFILFFISVITPLLGFAQQKPVKTDSAAFYKNIETYSKKSKFSKFVYGLIFKPLPVSPSKKKVKKKQYKKLIQKPYSAFEGKTIRHINIITYDPFGYSITILNAEPQDLISKAGNKLHVKTREITIRNLLLFRQNQIFDSLLVKESERLIRSRGYLHEVSFYVTNVSKKSDSVDILIRVLDNWSIIPMGGISASNVNINLPDQNFMGLGHEYQIDYTWFQTAGKYSFNTNYVIPNLKNTYINTTLHYNTDEYDNYNKSFAIDRPFFSPFAKWAAGINFTQQFKRDSIKISESGSILQRFKLNSQDYWAGFARQIFKGNTEDDRTTNLITSVGLLKKHFAERPLRIYDSLQEFSEEDIYMISIGISSRKYVQDKYIFNYGVTEDVPIGSVYGLTVGYQLRENTNRMYAGLRYSFGNYHEWGYLSCNFEYGTFIHRSHSEQGVFRAEFIYFTGLRELGKWKFRQFIKPQFTLGINRFAYENMLISNENFVKGFSSSDLTGTRKLFLTLQTQSYSPWNVLGFRFGPYLVCSMGVLGNEKNGFSGSKLYSQFSVGVLIKNDYLVFNSFQLSIAYFPFIPGEGYDVFKLNPNSTTDFGFRDFIIGKPAVTVFQ
jgi:hypothetical protein